MASTGGIKVLVLIILLQGVAVLAEGVTVYVPGNVLNQSHVVILFSSGAGVEVVEGGGQISAKVFLPQTFMNMTQGLFGNWSGYQEDDFTFPNGLIGTRPGASQAEIFSNFGSHWRVSDAEDPQQLIGRSIFYHEYDRNSASYYDASYIPDFNPVIPDDSMLTEGQVSRLCGYSEACRYDYITTGRREFAAVTLITEDALINLKSMDREIFCGTLFPPKNGRKTTNKYTVGTRVKFDCDAGYVLVGERERECFASGYWSWPNNGETQCIRTGTEPSQEVSLDQVQLPEGPKVNSSMELLELDVSESKLRKDLLQTQILKERLEMTQSIEMHKLKMENERIIFELKKKYWEGMLKESNNLKQTE